jgi:hypothetical protein
MDSYSGHRCWEITNCDNLNCPARGEPETPCWEIAKRDEEYHNILNTCEDCIVYLLKVETSILDIKELQNIFLQRGLLNNIETDHLACVLKVNMEKSGTR